jgi:hypothetical protein
MPFSILVASSGTSGYTFTDQYSFSVVKDNRGSCPKSKMIRTEALRPIQPSIQWVKGALVSGVKWPVMNLATHPHFTTCLQSVHTGNFTVLFICTVSKLFNTLPHYQE